MILLPALVLYLLGWAALCVEEEMEDAGCDWLFALLTLGWPLTAVYLVGRFMWETARHAIRGGKP